MLLSISLKIPRAQHPWPVNGNSYFHEVPKNIEFIDVHKFKGTGHYW